MLIWTGWGILVPFISGTMIVFFNFVLPGWLIPYEYTSYSTVIGILVNSFVLWFLGKRLNRPTGDVYIHKETGQEVVVRPNHSFFFIKIEYWAFIIPVIGLIILFSN